MTASVANNPDQKVMVTNEEKSAQEAQQVRVLTVKAWWPELNSQNLHAVKKTLIP